MIFSNVTTVWIEALKEALNQDAPYPDIRGISVTPEYPMQAVHLPALWVNFVMQGVMQNAGIDHQEFIDADSGVREVFRWKFGGIFEINLACMGNLERSLMLDALTRTIAVGRAGVNHEGVLRDHVQTNDLVPMNVSWESFTVGSFSETVGTPWGTDDVIYEATVSIDIEGECVLDPQSGVLVPLSSIVIYPLSPGEPDPTAWI